jgi:hypothetical protein
LLEHIAIQVIYFFFRKSRYRYEEERFL